MVVGESLVALSPAMVPSLTTTVVVAVCCPALFVAVTVAV